MGLLQQKGALVTYHDPHVPVLDHDGMQLTCESDLESALQRSDCVLVVTDHTAYDFDLVRKRAQLIVDTRHATMSRPSDRAQGTSIEVPNTSST